jgi:hypothetical protein
MAAHIWRWGRNNHNAGGTISGNTAGTDGGGVYFGYTFDMQGGTIHDIYGFWLND